MQLQLQPSCHLSMYFCIEAVIASRKVSALLILDSPQEIESIRQKLPASINQRWRRKKFTFIERHGFEPKFKDFSKFLEREADISASDKYFTCLPAPPKLKDVRRRFKKLFNYTTGEVSKVLGSGAFFIVPMS